MRSTAQIKGHPIHPALIPFPFAFLTGALLFDALGWIVGEGSFVTTGRYLAVAGVAAALVAAVPGIVDYFNTVPPNSSGKRRARKHGLLNLTAVALFAIAIWLRAETVGLVVLGVEAAAVALLSYAGWLGGTLVNRNMIGVDHRYADAGKWKEAHLEGKDEWLPAAREDELKPGQMKLLHVKSLDGRRVALARTARGYVAFDDRCTHRGGSLAGGVLVGTTVQCLWHGSQFDVETGAVRCGPAKDSIARYDVMVSDGEVRVRVRS